jgi:hypothetical protein
VHEAINVACSTSDIESGSRKVAGFFFVLERGEVETLQKYPCRCCVADDPKVFALMSTAYPAEYDTFVKGVSYAAEGEFSDFIMAMQAVPGACDENRTPS